MPPDLVQMFVLGGIGFGAMLIFGLRTKQSYRWTLIAFGAFGLVAMLVFFLPTALHAYSQGGG